LKVTDVIALSYGSIKERKSRFALNLLGILIGCMAITGLVSITQGMNAQINEQLEILGSDTLMILPGELDTDMQSTLSAGSQVLNNPKTLSWRDKEILSKFTEVGVVAAAQSNYCTYTIKGEVYTTLLLGTSHEIFELFRNFEVIEGRTLTRQDKSSAIIGSKVAHPSGENEPILKVGDRLRIKTLGATQEREITLRVVGIMKERGSMLGVNPDEMVLIPLRTSEQLFDAAGEYSMLQVNVPNIDDMEQLAIKIEDSLNDVTVVTTQAAQDLVGSVTSIMEAVLGGVAAISLVVAGVGIFNTMTTSVYERTREIGVLKTVGARNFDILYLFLSEASITGVAGGIFGGGFGFILGRVIGNFINLPIVVGYPLWLSVVFFACFTSVLSGAIPAWRAAKLNPVDALRHE